MEGYSLYTAIKDKLTPQQQKNIENQIRYNQLVKPRRKYVEDEF